MAEPVNLNEELPRLVAQGCVLIKVSYLQFDVVGLRNFYDTVCKKARKGRPRAGYGGWSILSNTGEVDDGFQRGGYEYDENSQAYKIDKERMEKKYLEGVTSKDFIKPTELYTPFIKTVMDQFRLLNLQPFRTRIAKLDSGASTAWHVDSLLEDTGHWRGHIVIKTSKDALFRWRKSNTATPVEYNIPADGFLYLARIDVPHIIETKKDRVHLITDFNKDFKRRALEIEPILFME